MSHRASFPAKVTFSQTQEKSRVPGTVSWGVPAQASLAPGPSRQQAQHPSTALDSSVLSARAASPHGRCRASQVPGAEGHFPVDPGSLGSWQPVLVRDRPASEHMWVPVCEGLP